VLSVPGALEPSYMFDAWVEVLPSAPVPIKQGTLLRVHHGSAELMGRIVPLPQSVLEPGSAGPVQLRLDKEMLALPGDRFVLRRSSPLDTLAGGIILHNKPAKHRRKNFPAASDRLQELVEILTPNVDEAALVESFVAEKGAGGINVDELVARTGFLREHLEALLGKLDSIIVAPGEPPIVSSLSAVAELGNRLTDFLEQFHHDNPLSFGAPREELRKRILPQSSSSHFQFLLQRLEEEERISTRGAEVASAGRRVRLTPEQEMIK